MTPPSDPHRHPVDLSTEFVLSPRANDVARSALTLVRDSLQAEHPIDRLVARLDDDHGDVWCKAAFADEPFASWPGGAQDLLDGRTSVEELDALKRFGKRIHRRGDGDRDAEDRGLLLYLVAVGGALAHHDAWLSTGDRGQVRDILLDLASATSLPEGWSALLERAGSKLTVTDDA